MKRCKVCGSALIKKETQHKPSQLKKQYYYTAYYYCPKCKKMYLSDEFKVHNDNFDLFTHHNLASGPIDVEIWTDGASRNNGRPHAKAAWAFVAGETERSGVVEGKQTNNIAEALAMYHALLWAAKKGHKKIKIYTDSQITIHNMRKQLDQIKANQDIFAKIFHVIEKNNLEVFYKKVLGHSGDINNERADKLANTRAGIKENS